MNFKIGDNVKCIDVIGGGEVDLELNKTYKIIDTFVSFDCIKLLKLEGITGFWYPERFESVSKSYQFVFEDGTSRHKLVCSDGRETNWAGYTQTTYMDGMVGVTAYYGIKEAVMTSDEFCKMNSVGVPEND